MGFYKFILLRCKLKKLLSAWQKAQIKWDANFPSR